MAVHDLMDEIICCHNQIIHCLHSTSLHSLHYDNRNCVLILGLDRYQYSVSVSGRYQWYRFGIGIADTAADTRTDTGRP